MAPQQKPVVVVTGASAGVGRAVVRKFARHGAKIGLIARGKEGLEGARAEVEQMGSEALVLPADVADPAAIEASAAAVESRWGPIDIWINNAMVSVFSPVKEMTAAEFRRVTDVTYLGYVHGTLAALKRMLPRDRGMIVQVGSALSYRGIPLQSAYCAAKHAIEGFSESLRTELIHDNSRVKLTLVHLPALNTPQHGWSKSRMPRKAQPVPPIFAPDLAAAAIYHAAFHYRREWTLGMITDIVLAGNKLAPGLGDWYMAKTGYESQMTPEPEDPARPHNLWKPLPGDAGSNGRFGAQMKRTSFQWWLTRNRFAVGVAAATMLGIGWLACSSHSERQQESRR